ncbi:hypothetical protein BO78DRAFT_87062 [Aspergillus sclerotiicarbonarius CBS 121057]|uniref:Uncharacterized protein n=1 Tax=Aspergillus sclerotiicarbonarius (strain CBS 121057 / IBT 28362) TaxID=1448318 RepID=A0A319FJ58_ASPSB|nr:hypothetical protein BO78DRAFT_87062 [Aspergillus sclerotiicarbonarius CBS 121057]
MYAPRTSVASSVLRWLTANMATLPTHCNDRSSNRARKLLPRCCHPIERDVACIPAPPGMPVGSPWITCLHVYHFPMVETGRMLRRN